nr:immunoglobulin heavy chain junction region [Mus musculus]MBK4186611.1 immunoglobulin heavy chain junction region [Mus musculus]MBK4197320.1 immunoglobulin heavy chain junction region [Mus musculus]
CTRRDYYWYFDVW